MNAIGLVEVIGYVAAIEACDTCVKSANVNLVSLDKVGSGIVTLTISGDVGAVKSAVEAAEVSVERIGTLRSTHVIPRMNKEVAEVLFKKEDKKEIKEEVDIKSEVKEALLTEVSSLEQEQLNINEDSNIKANSEILEDNTIEVNHIEEIDKPVDLDEIIEKEENTNSDKDDLSKKSVKELKAYIKKLNSSLTNKDLNSLKKEELIDLINKLIREDR
ncbi:hypothetical protein SDC9_149860 [bioreactor metagenome]|uniref:BMC domain-containing protein n=1 Tax=bioreactor metagenome TaxID=1076179 RepID=A0A645EPW2_9ZZZZ|nr:BMC domain-containing protein [Romboutsia lituseburensis]